LRRSVELPLRCFVLRWPRSSEHSDGVFSFRAEAYFQPSDPVAGFPGLMSYLLPPPVRKVAPAATLNALLLPYRVLPLALILAPATAALMPMKLFCITLFSA
jgi:hypothetical protein